MNDRNTDKRNGFPEAKFTPVKPFTKEEEDRIIKKVHDELIAEGYTMVNGKFVAPKEMLFRK